MVDRFFDRFQGISYLLLLAVLFSITGCNITRHVGDNQYLLRSNSLVLRSEHPIAKRGEIRDNLTRLIIQKPNSRLFGIPFKLSIYNKRYDDLHNKPDSLLPKSVERPVVFDTSLIVKSKQNMKSYLFNQGYFYATVKDAYAYKRGRAFITYSIDMGKNYTINNLHYDIDDSSIAHIVQDIADETALKKGKEFTYSLLDEELSRITSAIRNRGYYKFTQENITFQIDTTDRSVFKKLESPVDAALNFVSQPHNNDKSTIDIYYTIRLADDTAAYTKFHLGKINVYAEYKKKAEQDDSTLTNKTIDGITFHYYDYFVHANVLYNHIYLYPDDLYSQEAFDRTHAKLNELGIFQYIRMDMKENHRHSDTLNCNIFLDRAKKYDFSTFYNISSGSTYSIGHQLGANIRNKDFMKGANLLTVGVNGGFEYAYNNTSSFIRDFSTLTEYYGANASLDFPKFLAPAVSGLFDNSNTPHTVLGVGENVMDRVNYFTMINTSANFTYNWHQNKTVTWTFSPVFINIIRLPVVTDSFQKVLDTNAYLKNSYKQNFIEGENISFTYDDIVKKHGSNYSYLKLALEEAGGLLGVINQFGVALNDLYTIKYAQYTKFDFDARHYFTLTHSAFAFRFYGGIGIPYGQSSALPYIKQYYVGGPYSLRGWPIRTLGPGSYYDAANINNSNEVDITGDIKLELNGEYRFPITPMFAGAVRMNGAVFADAGNIWLAQNTAGFEGGEFEFSTLGHDIAMDMGAGLRFDIESFLTFRIDVAMPVKKPYVGPDYGWVFNQIAFSDPTWRATNIVPVFSIGYPF